MGIVIAIALLGALFVSDNQEFFDTVDRQKKEGYTWHYTGKQPLSEPPVPSLPLQVIDVDSGEEIGEPYVLWKLKKD